MAARISIATGNLTTATTWALVDNSASTGVSYLDSEAASADPTSTPKNSATFAWAAGAPTIDGIAVKIATRPGTTGTITCVLRDIDLSSDVKTVTINVNDIPSNNQSGWYLFKFASIALTNGKNYAVRLSTSSASGQVTCYAGSGNDWARMLRTTTTGAPAANDQLHVIGEWTAAATSTAFTVTQDDTAATSYGPTVSGGPPQGMTIGNKGTLISGATGGVNYSIKMKGIIAIYEGGTFQMGTTGTKMPANSTSKLELASAANVDTGIQTFGAAVFTCQGDPTPPVQTLLTASIGGYVTTNGTAVTAVTSQCQDFTGMTGAITINGVGYTISSVTDGTHLTLTGSAGVQASPVRMTHAGTAATLIVASTTGMAANGQICVGSTSRTNTDCEMATITTVDSATQLTLSAALTKPHLGTSPTQAEVGYLTRNVQIFGTSTSLQGFISISATATVDVDYAEFYNMGSATANKRGIDCATTTGSCSIQFSSLHDFVVTSSLGFNATGTSGNGFTFSSNVVYNINNVHLTVAATSATWTVDSCLFMLNVAASTAGCTLSDTGGTFTNIIVVGMTGIGVNLAQNAVMTGTIGPLTIHSVGGNGLSFGTNGVRSGTISSLLIWRCTGMGITNPGSGINDIVFSTVTLFGNATANISFGASTACMNVSFISLTSSGDTIFSTTSGFEVSSNGASSTSIFSSSFGVVSGIKTAHANDINISAANAYLILLLNNCILASATEVASQANLTATSFISSQKHDQTAGLHKIWKATGTIAIETGTVHTGSQSMALTPSSTTTRLDSRGPNGGWLIAAASGATVTPTVWLYKTAAYDGAQPRLMVARNDAIGINADTVLATYSAGTGSWNSISGATVAFTDDGVCEVYVDCIKGTGGVVYVDSLSVA